MEADLIRMGMRLRWFPTADYTWRDLLIVVRHSGVDTELYKAMYPNDAGWTLTNMLLATIADCLRWLQWAKTTDGRKNMNAPEPIVRPGVKGRKRAVHPKGKGAPRSKIRKLLGREIPDRAKRLAALFAKDGE